MCNELSQSFRCGACGREVRSTPSELSPTCPNCRASRWTLLVVLSDDFPATADELDAVGSDDQGTVVAERRDRTDLNSTATVSANAGADVLMTVNREHRVKGFDGEQPAAESLATAYNHERGTAYTVESKSKEDSGYEDRVLVSKRDTPPRIGVQIRHVDDAAIRAIGQQRQFAGVRSSESLVAMVRIAIDAKAQIDTKVRSATILLLQTPAVLGQIVRQQITTEPINSGGFREVWLAPFRERAFRLD